MKCHHHHYYYYYKDKNVFTVRLVLRSAPTTMPGDVSKKSKEEKQEVELLEDHTCPICMYLLIEPVTLPCEHELCLSCFQQNVQESLCCPMCRCRISSWVRRQARLNNLVNQERWKQIKSLFPEKVRLRLEGYEDDPNEDEEVFHPPAPRLAEPGEIREEYEKALQKLAEERDAERRREEEASAALLRTLQEEEKRMKEEMKKLESQLKKDEELARILETAGTPALRQKVEEEAKNDKQNIQLLLTKLHENESVALSTNNSSSSSLTPHDVSARTDNHNYKRKLSPVSPSQSKQPRLIQVTPRQPIRKSSEAHVRSPSPISGNGITHKNKQKSKLNIVDHFEKLKSFQSVGQSSPNNISASRTDSFTSNCKESQSLNSEATTIYKDSTNVIATGTSNKLGRKILFEKKLNFDKCDSKSRVSKSRTKSNLRSSPSACNGTKLDMYFRQKEKRGCEVYMAGEGSRSSEEKDRLFALALQKQYDMELKMSRQVNRAKGTSDEYKLRQKTVTEEKNGRGDR